VSNPEQKGRVTYPALLTCRFGGTKVVTKKHKKKNKVVLGTKKKKKNFV
jgi:hypothetical protein